MGRDYTLFRSQQSAAAVQRAHRYLQFPPTR